jgi:hypothetical protein
VVDTGIHTKRWTREQATQYFVDTVGFARGRSQREIERYSVSPGQACSYKIGHAAWLRARENARRIAGPRFDLRQFTRCWRRARCRYRCWRRSSNSAHARPERAVHASGLEAVPRPEDPPHSARHVSRNPAVTASAAAGDTSAVPKKVQRKPLMRYAIGLNSVTVRQGSGNMSSE